MTVSPLHGRPRPLNSLVASAQRITRATLQRGWGKSKAWQDDAWDMFDLVGEHRFLAVTLAGRMAQAKIFVGKMPSDDTEDPVPVEDTRFTAILDSVGGTPSARAQLIARMGTNLFVTGDGWLVGIPKQMMPPSLLVGPLNEPTVDPGLIPQQLDDGTLDIADLVWRMMSITEVTSNAGGEVTLRMGETPEEQLIVDPNRIVLVRVWRPHPRLWWEADSPTRSSLPVLRELVGLTMRSSAEIDSRLAGAGLLIVPQSAQRALQIAAGLDEVDPAGSPDQFTEALMEAMLTPISDRSSASAIVPLVVTVPDEACSLFTFIDFSKELDVEQPGRVDTAIRRLALGLDAPPELLLGTGGMNHWGAWLVLEDVVTTHLEPPLALVCDALTTQYLWPVLVDQGMDPVQAQEYVIWYDVSDLVVRPTRAADALTLHNEGVISDSTLRDANGFDDSDAPITDEDSLEPATRLALDMARANPVLMANPGLPQLVAQIQTVLDGKIPAFIDPEGVAQERAGNLGQPGGSGGQGMPAPPGGTQPGSDLPAVPSLPARGPQPAAPSRSPGPARVAASVANPDRTRVYVRTAWGDEMESRTARWRDYAATLLAPPQAGTLIAAGVAVHAADTGRVLMIQRSIADPSDPAAGTWEFPGGKIEPQETPLAAAQREWSEETGHLFPEGRATGQWTSPDGVYQGYVWEIPQESEVQLNLDHEDRHVLNPDDPDGDGVEVIAWWELTQLQDNPAVRAELSLDMDVVLDALKADQVGTPPPPPAAYLPPSPSARATGAASFRLGDICPDCKQPFVLRPGEIGQFGGKGSGRHPCGSGKRPNQRGCMGPLVKPDYQAIWEGQYKAAVRTNSPKEASAYLKELKKGSDPTPTFDRSYAGTAQSFWINEAMREDTVQQLSMVTPVKDPHKLVADLQREADEHRLKEPVVVYRGLKNSAWLGQDSTVGSTLTDNGFQSTSMYEQYAAWWATGTRSSAGNRALMEIVVPAGTPAVPIGGDEFEMTLGDGLTLRIVSDEEDFTSDLKGKRIKIRKIGAIVEKGKKP